MQGRGLKQKARAPETIDSSHGMRPSSEGRGRGGGQDGGIKTRNPALPRAKSPVSLTCELRAQLSLTSLASIYAHTYARRCKEVGESSETVRTKRTQVRRERAAAAWCRLGL